MFDRAWSASVPVCPSMEMPSSFLNGIRKFCYPFSLSFFCLCFGDELQDCWFLLELSFICFSNSDILDRSCLIKEVSSCLFSRTCWERADPWLSFVVLNFEFVTFPLVSWVRCGTSLY